MFPEDKAEPECQKEEPIKLEQCDWCGRWAYIADSEDCDLFCKCKKITEFSGPCQFKDPPPTDGGD